MQKMNINKFDQQMYENTEKENDFYPPNAANEISLRYKFATSHCINKKILEVGPGNGYGCKALISNAKNYKAIEFSENNVKEFKSKFPLNDIFHGDFLKYKLPSKSKFDCIVSLANIYYFDFHQFLKKCNELIENQGLLIFCTSNKLFPNFKSAEHTTKYYDLEDLSEILKKNNYTPKFFGAFKKNEEKNIKEFTLSIFKFLIKSILPSKLYILLKQITKQSVPLPKDLSSIKVSLSDIKDINSNSESKSYLIIYCVAVKNGN